MEVGKEILTINSHQRIIFVSDYVKDALSRTINELNMPVEILQKPVSNQILIDIVEETEIYDELKKFKIDVSAFRNAGFRHESLKKKGKLVRMRMLRSSKFLPTADSYLFMGKFLGDLVVR